MRRLFADLLYQAMKKNDKIYLLVGDLGYKVWDKHFEDFPNRCFNCGASEQAMMGIAVGLALEGKIPFVYSITNFILYRPFETLRNYLNYERIPVKLIGAGRGKDYEHDGISHWSEDAVKVLKTLPMICQYFPDTKEEIPEIFNLMLTNDRPSFISLKR